METKKVGIRVVSRFHVIEPDTSEALCYFAEMMDSAVDDGEDGSAFTKDDADELFGIMRDALGTDDDCIDIYTEGELYVGDGKLELRYAEPEEVTGMGKSVTSITFTEERRDIVTVTRGGDVYSALVLERGVRHTCAYNTEVMPLLVYTTAKRIENTLTASGGVIDMVYTVETRAGTAQYNRVTVTVGVMED